MLILNWEARVREILKDLKLGTPVSEIAAAFHNTMAEMIVSVAMELENHRVVLSGGCFQNQYLVERAVMRLEKEGFRCYLHQRVPPNDGGIALGQVAAGHSILKRS